MSRYIFVRKPTQEEKDRLYTLLEDGRVGYRAKIILLSSQGYPVPQIRVATNHHDQNICKWIHRFNEEGMEGLMDKPRSGRKPLIGKETRDRVAQTAKTNPQELGLPIGGWSLRVLVAYLRDQGITVSYETVRQILLEAGISWRKSQRAIASSDPEYELKRGEFSSSTGRGLRAP